MVQVTASCLVTPSHNLSHAMQFLVNWSLRNKETNFSETIKSSCQENSFVICKMLAILFGLKVLNQTVIDCSSVLQNLFIAEYLHPWFSDQFHWPATTCISSGNSCLLIITVGTPYNTNVGVQKIPDRAIWKPMVAKRNNTNPWSWLRPQILVTQDSHMSKQPASRDWPEQIAPLVHSSQTAWQLFNLGQSIEIGIPHLLGHIRQLHTKCDSVSPCCKQQICDWAVASRMRTHNLKPGINRSTVSFTLCWMELVAEPSGSKRDPVTV